MQYREAISVALTGIYTNKTRALLTMLGILFGVAAVIAMVSIGEGAKQETIRQIELLGTNNVIINRVDIKPSGPQQATNFSPGLTIKDANSILKVNPLVEEVTYTRSLEQQLIYRSEIQTYFVTGTTPAFTSIFNAQVQEGTFFTEQHNRAYSNVAVIGSSVKSELFPFEKPIGKKIKVGEQWFTIIGVLSPKATATAASDLGVRDFNNEIYIPFSTFVNKLEELPETDNSGRTVMVIGGGDGAKIRDRISVDQLTVKVKTGKDLKEAADLLRRTLTRLHYGIPDFSITLPEQLLSQKQQTQRIFNVVMGAIAGISLLVGGIGIMNIMLANIMERTREIGVRRAVGATRSDILLQFLTEATAISFIGGMLGIVFGFILTKLISTYAGWTTVVPFSAIVLAFSVSVATGIVFGFYPAKKAADKNPIESLRYE